MKTSSSTALLLVVAAGAFIAGRTRPSLKGAPVREALYYVDPMHPSYRSNRPGIAPDCGMELVPVYATTPDHPDEGKKSLTTTSIHIDRIAQGLYGIQVSRVERDRGVRTVRAFGKVVPDETQMFRINLGTDGYVKNTIADAVGTHVAKNQHLALVYSPDFLSVVGGYLSANERLPGASGKDASSTVQNTASAQARADRLRNLGMSDAQIDEISISRKIPEDVYVVSPVDGFVVSRNISPGLRFERNTDLYTIADLRHVWIVAEILGADESAFHPGASTRVRLTDNNEEFKAVVSEVLPESDPQSHTLKVRLVADNPHFKLRPEMLVSVELDTVAPTGLSIPASAVLDSGIVQRVFVQASDGYFSPRIVQLGRHFDNRVEVVKGLSAGDLVASAGTFLIDSESRLEAPVDWDRPIPAAKTSEMALGLSRAETRP